ncbi:MAG: ABC transporter ATP-binding protein [Deltaproteobacteria bacterium]|nr:ABC transporter ATP-binding protein [Deltaproteobacteria bacterium]
MSTPLIQFVGVQKAFGPKVIYDDLSLDIFKGETIVILGGSGSGKSVLLKILIGLLEPDAGEVRIDGKNVAHGSEDDFLPIRKRISMLFQGGALFDSISVAENVAYPLREHSALSDDAIDARVREALARVGLAGSEHLSPSDLSGGMKKRAALARAIVAEPEVLLYDEPTTGLDPANTRRISELILQIQRDLKVTSIVVTHDMPCAFLVGDRIAMLHDRRVRLAAPVDAFKHTQDPVIKDFIYAMEPQK